MYYMYVYVYTERNLVKHGAQLNKEAADTQSQYMKPKYSRDF